MGIYCWKLNSGYGLVTIEHTHTHEKCICTCIANVVGVHSHMNYTAPCASHSFCTSPKDIINCPQKEFANFSLSVFTLSRLDARVTTHSNIQKFKCKCKHNWQHKTIYVPFKVTTLFNQPELIAYDMCVCICVVK